MRDVHVGPALSVWLFARWESFTGASAGKITMFVAHESWRSMRWIMFG